MDPRIVLRTRVKAWSIGVLAATCPVVGGLILIRKFIKQIHQYRWPAYKNMIAIQNLDPFHVVASMLVDLKIMNSKLGNLALASALISDLISNFISTIVSYGRLGLIGMTQVIFIHSAILTLGVVSFILFVGRPFVYGSFEVLLKENPLAVFTRFGGARWTAFGFYAGGQVGDDSVGIAGPTFNDLLWDEHTFN